MFRLTVIVIVSLCRYNYAQITSSPNGSLTSPADKIINPNTPTTCGEPRRCIPHYQCLTDGTIDERGEFGMTPRLAGDGSNTFLYKNELYSLSANSTITLRNGIEIPICHYLEACCGSEQDTTIGPTITSSPTGCGYSNPNGLMSPKINDAHKAQYGEFPWIVAVMINYLDRINLTGAGSLIHPKVILTAAHIFGDFPPNRFIVRAGEWDTQTTKEYFKHQDRIVTQIIRHDKYERRGLRFNHALVIVEEPFVLNVHIQPICLPTDVLDFDEEKECYSAGWGKKDFLHDARYETIMKKVKLPMVPFEICQTQLQQTRLGDVFKLHNSFMCAGGIAGQDTCTGDGGSPLMCPIPDHKNRYYQVGIVSWGVGCGDMGVPGVYANVGLVRDWIDNKMNVLGFGTHSYITQ